MKKKAHFFTDSKYISYIQYKSLYSFWLTHKDWEINLYFSNHKTSRKPKGVASNWFNASFEFSGRKTEVFFDKLGFSNQAPADQKEVFLKQYILKKLGGLWLKADTMYFENAEVIIDPDVKVYENKKLTFETETERMISLVNDTYMFDAIDYYSKKGKILDIGCGDKGIQKTLKNQNITSVDGWEKFEPDLVWDLNVLPLPYEDNSFDTVLALDLIEHLERDNGEKLLVELQRVAKKNILLLTPLFWTENTQNVDDPESPYYQNEYDLHRSKWTLDDFKDWTRLTDKKYYADYFFGVWEKK